MFTIKHVGLQTCFVLTYTLYVEQTYFDETIWKLHRMKELTRSVRALQIAIRKR